MAVKITFVNGVVDAYDFANVVRENLEKEGFKFVNNGYEPMSDKVRYVVKKDGVALEELLISKKMTKENVENILKEIKRIKNSHTPRVEEIEFDL